VRCRFTATLLLLAALTAGACGSRSRPPRVYPTPPPDVASTSAVRVLVDGSVRSIALEEYVAGCVVAELGTPKADAAAARRARQVQAILCRSYAISSRGRHAADHADVCSRTHCQVYRDVPATETGRLAREAADDTKGVVLMFEGRTVRPLYHAACGGRTSAASDVWPGNGEPWLVSVADETCASGPAWTFRVEIDRLGRALAADGRLAVNGQLREVEVGSRDAAGRAAFVRLVSRTTALVRGDDFRAAVMRAFGARSVTSTLFSTRREGTQVVFEGRGAGHGVGLCQAGAVRLAALGQLPESILRRYFPGTSLSRID
jgi:stage II sporulation protein D